MTGITSCISWDGRRLFLIESLEKALPLAFLGMEEDYSLSSPWKSDKLDCNLSLIFDDLLTRQIGALAFPSNFAPQHKYPTRKKHKGT